MHYNTSDSFLTAAFAVVKEYDPATYRRMANDNAWNVGIKNHISGYGVTLSDRANPAIGFAITYLNYRAINEWSENYNVHVALFAASVLVHEYRHAHQARAVVQDTELSESQAFHASSAFASKLPGREGLVIKELSDRTLADVASDPAYAMQDAMNNR
jgi:hypothetical protein